MSLQFSSRIHQLTAKLQHLNTNEEKGIDLEQLKDQVVSLHSKIKSELNSFEKRIKKIEGNIQKNKLKMKKENNNYKQQLYDKQNKVTEILTYWIEDYQIKAQKTKYQIQQEERTYKAKIQQEQIFLNKQARTLENRIKDLFHTLQKQTNKLQAINQQNYINLSKDVTFNIKILTDSLLQEQKIKNQMRDEIQKKIKKIRQSFLLKYEDLRHEIKNKNAKTRKILQLLIDID